jgi:ubiquinone/menaquinone biosynthesis C-methylase UbiE
MTRYMHGYSDREAERLHDQSSILRRLLHSDVAYPAGSKVLEAGCGVGAQTVALAKNSLASDFTSIDISTESLERAQALVESEGMTNVHFRQADVMDMPFDDGSFDHVFVCFLLEHLQDPPGALAEMMRVLKKGGTITAIEGDHGSCFWHPETPESRQAWNAMIRVQQNMGHDPLIGRRLYLLLSQAGFDVKDVIPLWAYADSRNPELVDGAVNRILAPMMETAREEALQGGIIDRATWDKGVSDMKRAAMPPDGSVFYTWFRGIGTKGA